MPPNRRLLLPALAAEAAGSLRWPAATCEERRRWTPGVEDVGKVISEVNDSGREYVEHRHWTSLIVRHASQDLEILAMRGGGNDRQLAPWFHAAPIWRHRNRSDTDPGPPG